MSRLQSASSSHHESFFVGVCIDHPCVLRWITQNLSGTNLDSAMVSKVSPDKGSDPKNFWDASCHLKTHGMSIPKLSIVDIVGSRVRKIKTWNPVEHQPTTQLWYRSKTWIQNFTIRTAHDAIFFDSVFVISYQVKLCCYSESVSYLYVRTIHSKEHSPWINH